MMPPDLAFPLDLPVKRSDWRAAQPPDKVTWPSQPKPQSQLSPTCRPREVSVNTRLLGKPSGCILWLEFDPVSLAIEQFFWFGGPARAGLPELGERRSRHSKANSKGEKNVRPAHRVVAKRDFRALVNIGEVVEELFG
jgi:hypothetical protein